MIDNGKHESARGGRRCAGGRTALRLMLITLFSLALVSISVAAANREIQTRVMIQSIVSRIAFKHIVGFGVDFPGTIPSCINRSQRDEVYKALAGFLASSDAWPAGRPIPCNPHDGKFETAAERIIFSLPSRHCREIGAEVTRALDDFRGEVLRQSFDATAQERVESIFSAGRHGFPSTSGLTHSRFYEFKVEGCHPRSDGDFDFVVKVKKRL